MISLRLSSRDRILKTTVSLQRERPFFSYILMNFETKETQPETDIPTMGVSKYGRLYWNDKFVSTLSGPELMYVLCHEVLHMAKGDFYRQGKRHMMIWNIASDAAINLILNDEGLTPPKDGIIPDKNGNITFNKKMYNVKGKTTEEIYDDLIKDVEIIEVCVQGKGGKGDKGGHGGFDVHIQGDKDDKGESTGDEKDGASSAGKAAEGKWRKVAIEAATVARQRGKLPGSMESLIEGMLNPVVDWRSRLRSFITNEIPVDFCNRLPGRRFYGTDVWSPRMLRENISLFVSIDCSGSTMGERERFTGEIQGIVTSHPQLKARLIFWSYGEISDANDIPIDTQTVDKLKGINLKDVNGGTELSAYTRHFNKKGYSTRLTIHLTDGDIESKPEMTEGTHLFVLCGSCNDSIVKEYGECIKIKDEVRSDE